MKSVQIRARAGMAKQVRQRKRYSFIVQSEYDFCDWVPLFLNLFCKTARVSVRKQADREYMEELRDLFIATKHKIRGTISENRSYANHILSQEKLLFISLCVYYIFFQLFVLKIWSWIRMGRGNLCIPLIFHWVIFIFTELLNHHIFGIILY